MKRVLLLAAGLFATAPSWAEIVLQNAEKSPFYYFVEPLGRDGSSPLLRNPAEVLPLLKARAAGLAALPPGAAAELRGEQGPSLICGFFTPPGRESYPVVTLKIPQVQSRLTFTVSTAAAGKAPLSLSVWEVNLGDRPILLDNRYLDWLKVPELARFSSSFSPVTFYREEGGARDSLKISESLYWKKGGTQIEGFKAFIKDSQLFLMVSTLSEMSRDLSLLLYWFQDRSKPGAPRYTLELPLAGEAGPVLLWLEGQRSPLVVGTFVKSGFFLEGVVDLAGIEALVPGTGAGSFDLATCFYNGDLAEEFFFTTIFRRDIPNN